MTQAITVDRAGRILLPIEVRRHLNLVPGSRLTLDVVAQRIELNPEAQPEAELMLTAGGRSRAAAHRRRLRCGSRHAGRARCPASRAK